MFLYYQNSFLASAVSVFGCLTVLMGLMDVGSYDTWEKVCIFGIGIALIVAGKLISNKKAFKTWWKQVEELGLVEKIRTDTAIARMVYSKNPIRATLKKIEELNPSAAEIIREEDDED